MFMYNLAMKILVVEDDPDIAEFIQVSFESQGYTVEIARDGRQGSYLARTSPFSLIVLDYSLPLKSGLEACTEIRETGSSVPILFLSVLDDAARKIEALTRGADDYLTKPFHLEELMARVKALLRRPTKIQSSVLEIGEMRLDTEKRTAYRLDKPIYLTRKEYSLLEYLMRNPETAVSRSMIMEHVWSADSDPFSNTVEAHILNLRKKVNAGHKRNVIVNIPGRGYAIEP